MLALGALGACTDVALVSFGEAGETCQSTAECVLGLECVGGVCVDPNAPPEDAGEEDVLGDVPSEDLVEPNDAMDATEDGGPDSDEVSPPTDVTDVGEVLDATDVTDATDASDALEDISDVQDGGATDTSDGASGDVVDTVDVPAPDADDDTADVPIDVPDDVEPIGPGLDEPCSAVCDVGLVCINQGDGTGLCKPLPFGLCAPCTADSDCASNGALCLEFPGGGSYCGAPCATSANCPTGFVCGGGQCVPLSESCLCTPAHQGTSLGCSIQNALGTCPGPVGVSPTAGLRAPRSPPLGAVDGLDNDCDSVTDEEPTIWRTGRRFRWGSRHRGHGGEVICAPISRRPAPATTRLHGLRR